VTTICWTVIHHAAAPVTQLSAKIAHVARHVFGSAVRWAVRSLHHSPSVAAHSRVWFELVCKVIPAAVAGGGLLVPRPANPPLLPEPPALIEPAPQATPLSPRNWHIPPTVASTPYLAPPQQAAAVAEPSTGWLLLIGVGGLVLIRFTTRLIRADPQGVTGSAG
jgi:hypothetical protein